MIQKRINLFTHPIKKSHKGRETMRKIRLVATGLTVITFICLIAVFLIQATIVTTTNRLDRETLLIKDAITTELSRQVQNHLVALRVQAIAAAQAQDIAFASTEARLIRLLADSEIKATLVDLSFTTQKDFTANLAFPSEEEMLLFVNNSENDAFSKPFALMKISAFAVSEATESARPNTLSISGALL